MKTKKLLSLFIASAISLQCAAVSVFASTDNAVTVVANDKDTDWVMQFNGWERLQPAYDYFSDWSVTDGFIHTHYGEKFGEVKSVAYYMTQDSAKAFTVYNETEPSADYQAWFNRDADGKPIPYDKNSTNAQLWYRKGRPNILARFNVGETTNNGQPIVISFDYQSTNPLTGAWVHGPGTAFKIMSGKDQVAYSLYNNADNQGFAIECIDIATAKATKKYITTNWDIDAEHSVKIVLSPELTAEGRYQMTAIELDGVVTNLEGVYGQTKGLTNVLIHSLEYSAGDNGQNKDYTDTIKNLKVVRGIEGVTVTSSVEDGSKDVNDKNVVLTFSDAVALAEGAIIVYENGAVMSSDSYTVTPGEDEKSATVAFTEYKSRASYKIAVNKALVTGLLGGKMSEDFELNFVSAKKSNVKTVKNDIDTDWAMNWNYERYEDGFSYMSDCSYDDGLKIVHYGDKYTEIKNNVFLSSVTDKNGVKTVTPDAAGNTNSFATDENDKIVAYTEDETQKLHPWQHKDRTNYEAKFNVGETSNDGQPIVVGFDYKTLNPGHETYMAAVVDVLGFYIYPNFQGTKVSSATGVGINNNADQTNYRQDVAVKIPVGEGTDPNGWHSVKLIISPELTVVGTEKKVEMTAIEVDGTVTMLDGIYGKPLSGNDKICVDTIIARLRTDKTNRSLEIKNLVVQRGIETIDVTSSVEDGATDVTPDEIKLNFSDTVNLADGAVKVYENGKALDSSAYIVTMSDDNKTAYITLNSYKSRQPYTITVDKSLVSGLTGGEMTEDFELNFVTSKNVEDLEGSDTNLAEGYTVTPDSYGPQGQKFVTVETADGITTITVDNDMWNKAAVANSDKSGNQEWLYDIDGDGTSDKLGYASWNYSGVTFKNIVDKKQSTEPLVISMEYSFENEGNNKNDIWVNMGDYSKDNNGKLLSGGTTMYMLSPFGAKPNVSGNGWNGVDYASGVTEKDWHTVQYVIDPTLDENNKTKITQITLDGEVIKDTSGQWISYKSAPEENAENGQYINTLSMRLSLVTDKKDANGNLLPTVLKMKNLKVLRAGEFNATVDSSAVSADENVLKVRFSDAVSEAELANLKVLKGSEIVEDAISAIALSADGKSADVTLNLDATARYSLVVSDVANIYGVKASTAPIGFEYYNTADFVTITNAQKTDDGTNTTVSFTLTSSEAVSGIVIVAAYDKENNLVGVTSKPVTVAAEYDTIDSVVLEKVTGADRVSVMVWDGFSNMKPYCMAKLAQ